MKQILLRGGLLLLASTSLTGCIDDNYDLSDIDTTSELSVKDLVLPINIDPITLGDIIEVKEEDQIKEFTLNGKTFYAIQEQGVFNSDPIHIPGFSTGIPSLEPSALEFHAPSPAGFPAPAAGLSVTLPLRDPINRSFAYSASNIDPSIVQLSDIFADMRISIRFDVDASISNIAEIELANLRLQLPKGLEIASVLPSGNYEPDGVLTIPSVKLTNGVAEIVLTATGINLEANGSQISGHALDINANVNIENAELKVTAKDNAAVALPENVSIGVTYDISDFNVKAVSGEIQYRLEGDGLNISPISLSNIPDFLSGDGTNLILANPQIYLQVNNPVAGYDIKYQTGIEIIPVRDTHDGESFMLDDRFFSVGSQGGVDGPYNYCLSPENPQDVPGDFAPGLNHVAFTSLSYVVSGDGIPEEVKINLVEPQIPTQRVNRFELDKDLVPLEGRWEFLAPLAMKDGTDARIIYTDVVDGWNDEDVDAITIETLEVNTNVTNATSLEAELTGYPIDVNGKQISGVEIVGATIPGGAKDAPVTIRITGEVRRLDGITFTATVRPSSNEALAPSQSITLSNIKVKVSGKYIKDF